MKISANVELDVEDFALGISYKDAQEVIKTIDKEQYDANFSFEMALYFIKQTMQYAEGTDWEEKLTKAIKGE